MLFNPKWKSDEATLDGFIAWLERQDPSQEYQYSPATTCAISRYLGSIGITYDDFVDGSFEQLCAWNTHITHPGEQTFGAALERAKAFAAKVA